MTSPFTDEELQAITEIPPPTLKPCAHCNGKAFLDADCGPAWAEVWIECEECGMRTIDYVTENEAINAWNRRATLAEGK